MIQTLFFFGTTAELIKIFPVTQTFKNNGIRFKVIHTGQNNIVDKRLLDLGSIDKFDVVLSHQKNMTSPTKLFFWFIRTLLAGIFLLKKLLHNQPTILILHGDTLSTLIGAVIGKIYGAKIFHIEAGLRSFDYGNPFPEEITRVLVSKFVDVHFCPNNWAVKNLTNVHGRKINTNQNTLIDSTNFALKSKPTLPVSKIMKNRPYFVAVIHRQENIYQKALFLNLIKQIIDNAKTTRCVFVIHTITNQALIKYGLHERIRNNHQIVTTDRLDYFDMIHLLKNASYLVTDGGSNQEESYYLGIPCLVLRKKTERNEGLNKNVILYSEKIENINYFFKNSFKFRQEPIVNETSPSRIIAKVVLEYINSG